MEKTYLFERERKAQLNFFIKKLYNQIEWINEYFEEMEGEFYQPGFYTGLILQDMEQLKKGINADTVSEMADTMCSLLNDVRGFNLSGCTYEIKARVIDLNAKDFIYAFLMYMDQDELRKYVTKARKSDFIRKSQRELFEIYDKMIEAVKLEEAMKNASM